MHLWHPFTQEGADPLPLQVRRGEGVFLEMQDGRRILDAISSWWVNLHGHSHPAIAAVNRFAAGVEAKLKPGADPQEILKAAVQSGAQITRFELLEPSLNEIFIEKTAHA